MKRQNATNKEKITTREGESLMKAPVDIEEYKGALWHYISGNEIEDYYKENNIPLPDIKDLFTCLLDCMGKNINIKWLTFYIDGYIRITGDDKVIRELDTFLKKVEKLMAAFEYPYDDMDRPTVFNLVLYNKNDNCVFDRNFKSFSDVIEFASVIALHSNKEITSAVVSKLILIEIDEKIKNNDERDEFIMDTFNQYKDHYFKNDEMAWDLVTFDIVYEQNEAHTYFTKASDVIMKRFNCTTFKSYMADRFTDIRHPFVYGKLIRNYKDDENLLYIAIPEYKTIDEMNEYYEFRANENKKLEKVGKPPKYTYKDSCVKLLAVATMKQGEAPKDIENQYEIYAHPLYLGTLNLSEKIEKFALAKFGLLSKEEAEKLEKPTTSDLIQNLANILGNGNVEVTPVTPDMLKDMFGNNKTDKSDSE